MSTERSFKKKIFFSVKSQFIILTFTEKGEKVTTNYAD